jgi:hypothetical protein
MVLLAIVPNDSQCHSTEKGKRACYKSIRTNMLKDAPNARAVYGDDFGPIFEVAK